MSIRFYIGLHQPSDSRHFQRVCLSVNRVRGRRSTVIIGHENSGSALLDSGAFTELATYGQYRHSVGEYAQEVKRLCKLISLDACVAQDYMCEPFMLAKTGLSLREHQDLTIERYDELLTHNVSCYVLPVLQGFAPDDYVAHIAAYGRRLDLNAWVGVGSVCKRNTDPASISRVLQAIKSVRPDLRLHGFGVKLTALKHPAVRDLLYSADSMAWSFHARKNGRSANDWREALSFTKAVEIARADAPWQTEMVI
jgi:hypothetical protein